MSIEQYSPIKAISLKVLHIFFVTVLLTLIKLIKGLPIVELVFFRSFFAFFPLALWLALRGKLVSSLRTRRPFGHLLRAFLSLFTMSMNFLAVRSLPLPEAVTLQYTQPIFVVALSAILLGERVRAFRWIAVGVGFSGALIVMWPKLTLLTGGSVGLTDTTLIGAGAALLTAVSLALTLIWLRQLVQTESSTTIALWLGIYASSLPLLTIPFGWVVPDLEQIGILLLVGLAGIAVQLTLSESLRYAPASTSAPFEYSSLIFAIASGFFIFGDIPQNTTLVGGTVLVAAGLVILWREQRAGVKPPTTRATGIPPE